MPVGSDIFRPLSFFVPSLLGLVYPSRVRGGIIVHGRAHRSLADGSDTKRAEVVDAIFLLKNSTSKLSLIQQRDEKAHRVEGAALATFSAVVLGADIDDPIH